MKNWPFRFQTFEFLRHSICIKLFAFWFQNASMAISAESEKDTRYACNISLINISKIVTSDIEKHREVRKYVENYFTNSPNPKFHYYFDQSHGSRPDCAAHPHKKVGLHLTVIVRLPLPGVIWHWVAMWLELVHTIFWHIFCPK